MSEIEPWRNPRPVAQSVIVNRLASAWLRNWLPAILWAAVIWTFSTKYFSAEQSGSILSAIAHRFFPSITAETLSLLNHYIRKTAHFTEYFIFCLLLFRAVRGGRKGWRWTWALAAFAIAAGYSALDEFHQSFVPVRTASPYDSLLDSAGAFVSMFVSRLWIRLRGPRENVSPSRAATPR